MGQNWTGFDFSGAVHFGAKFDQPIKLQTIWILAHVKANFLNLERVVKALGRYFHSWAQQKDKTGIISGGHRIACCSEFLNKGHGIFNLTDVWMVLMIMGLVFNGGLLGYITKCHKSLCKIISIFVEYEHY